MTTGYTDSNVTSALAQSATLSILFGVDSVVYGGLGEDGRLLFVQYLQRNNEDGPGYGPLLRRLEREALPFQHTFARVRLAVDSFYLTLSPQRLAKDGHDRLFLQQQRPLPDELYIGHHLVAGDTLRLSYGYPAATKVWLDQRFPQQRPLPFGAVLLDAASRLGSGSQRLFLHVQDQRLHLTFYDVEQLVYHNVFPFQTAKDFLYYVLLIYDQFGLAPERVPIYLSGTILPDGELYRLLYRYVRHLHLAAPPQGVAFGPQWDPATAHLYYPLLTSLTA